MSSFRYGDKVVVLKGIHRDRVGQILGEIRLWPMPTHYQVRFEPFEIEWYKARDLQEVEEEIPASPELLKWDRSE